MEDYMIEPAIKMLRHISRVPEQTITLKEIEEHFPGQDTLAEKLVTKNLLEWRGIETHVVGESCFCIGPKAYRLTPEGALFLKYWNKRYIARFFSGASGLLKNLLGRIFPGIGQ